MQEIFYPSDIINNATTVIPDLSTPLSGETLYVSCDVYVGFQSDLLSSVTINYSDGVSAVTVERLTQMTGNTYAMHFVLDRDYYINSNYEIEEFVASGRVQTTNESIYRDFSFGINQYGSNLQYIDGAYVTFTSHQDGSTVGLSKRSSMHETLEYFVEQAQGWRNLTTGVTITVNSGECVYVRGILTGNNTNSDYTNFRLVGDISVNGNCNAIWSYNDLNADLYQYCGHKLFSNCSGLTDVENLELPATTLAIRCYSDMFRGCTSLATAPELPATILENECYMGMFNECTYLATAPELPATTLAIGCYASMFRNCARLTTAHELPATTLASHCYDGMFYNCNSLTTAPSILPATTLADYCYNGMFRQCRLRIAPELPATVLAPYCYKFMFRDSSLNYIKCLATDISAIECTDAWLLNVATAGTFVKESTMTGWTLDSVDGIPSGWTVVDCPKTLCITNIDSVDSIVSVVNRSQVGIIINTDLKYSIDDGQTWVQWDYANDNITLSPMARVYLKGNNPDGFSKYIDNSNLDIKEIYITGGKVEVSGNVMGLLDDGVCEVTALPCSGCFFALFGWYDFEQIQQEYPSIKYAHKLILPVSAITYQGYTYMFRECKNLVTAPNLPATTFLGSYVYNTMFGWCESLLEAPKLPATSLSDYCYNWMFRSCTSLATAPELPATTLTHNCYGSMFQDCTSLTTAPELPATTLAIGCYASMFINCTSLTTAPELPATTLAERCYHGMFYGCSGLTTAPKLPATALANYCYYYMFSGCRSLMTAPELPATTLANYCYYYMFQGCISLNYIKCLAVNGINQNDSTTNWVFGVASVGIFIKHQSAVWRRGIREIPTGWTVYDFDNYIVS